MLTGDLVRATLRSGKVRPRYLRVDDEELQAETQVLIELFSRHIGAPVGRLEDAIADHIGDGTDFAVRRGLVKLLMDRATVEMVAPHSPPEVRRLVFEAAAARWPVGRGDDPARGRRMVLEEVGAGLNITAEQVEEVLYADLKSAHRLVEVELPEVSLLLERYNLSLAQAMLLKAHELVITLPKPDARQTRLLVRAMKFRQLLHRVEREGDTLVLRIDGPLSLFRQTQRYGLQLALFLPTVLALDAYELNAVISWGPARLPATFTLTEKDPPRSLRREKGLWVSEEEKQLRRQWKKLKTPWVLERCHRIVDLKGHGVLIPDYVIRHPDGRNALLELVWSWRRASFERRYEVLRQAAPSNLIVAVSVRRHVGEDEHPTLPEGTIVPFKGVIQAKRLIEAAEQVAS